MLAGMSACAGMTDAVMFFMSQGTNPNPNQHRKGFFAACICRASRKEAAQGCS